MGLRWCGGHDPGLCGRVFLVGSVGVCTLGGCVWVGNAGARGRCVGGLLTGVCKSSWFHSYLFSRLSIYWTRKD